MVHTVWLFNVFVSAVACGVFFVYALALGYRERTALVGALLLGVATIVWPYSKSFFREPLTLLMMLLAGLCAERWRSGGYRSFALLAGMALSLLGVLFTKASAVMALPALLLIAAPMVRGRNARRVLFILGVVVVAVAGVFVLLALFGEVLGVGARYNPLNRILDSSTNFLRRALQAYLLSPGGSVWGTSPILLLALPGWWIEWRAGRRRYLWVALLMTLMFAFGYALLSGNLWFGGLSWPPRFLIPVVPFLLLGALPALERATQPPFPRLLVVSLVALVLYSLWVQLSGVTLPWGLYTQLLPPESRGVLEWGRGLNYLQHLRWVEIPQAWGMYPLDFAWVRVATLWWWPYVFAALGAVCAWWLWRVGRGKAPRRAVLATASLPLALLVLMGAGLRGLYHDDQYLAGIEGLHALQPILNTEAHPGDLVLLSNRSYESFFLNYGEQRVPRVVSLPLQPGDRPSPQQPPQVSADNPDVLLTYETVPFLHYVASERERVWLLENAGPAVTWSVRPVERFMSMHYYPLRVIETDAIVRLIEYSTIPAPDPYAFRAPEQQTDLRFADALALTGFYLPSGTQYAPGDVLPLSLYWTADAPLAEDYTIAWFLRSEDGSAVAQGMDTPPGGGFERTSTWQLGVPHWDNRALRIPAGGVPGRYRLWVKVYALDTNLVPQDAPVTGSETLDSVIGVLPVEIEIR
jgi:hypothetical protein